MDISYFIKIININKKCCEKCVSHLEDFPGCIKTDCPCHCWLTEKTGRLPEMDKNGRCEHGNKVDDKHIRRLQATTPKNSEWRESFDLLFPITIFPQREYAHGQIKRFIAVLLQERSKELIEKIEDLKYDDEEDLGAEAIANHAYEDRFEAFRYGYNQALKSVLKLLSEQLNQK